MTAKPQPDADRPTLTRDDTVFLDGLRGLAALWVALHHASYLLFDGAMSRGASQLPTLDPDWSLASKLMGWLSIPLARGHFAVMFFFVLSGFVIHLRLAKAAAAGQGVPTMALGPYLYRRARRICPPFYFALALTAALDHLGLALGGPIYDGHSALPVIDWLVEFDYRASTVAGNAFFVQKIATPVLGSNGPLWSLAYEWWFYMAYPLLFLVARRSMGAATLAVGALYVVARLTTREGMLLNPLLLVLISLPLWWAGAMLAEWVVGRWRVKMLHLAVAAFCLTPITGYLAYRTTILDSRDLVHMTFFVGVIATCFHLQQRGWKMRLLRWLKPLGDCSYTLYIIHYPIMVFASSWIMRFQTERADWANPIWVPLVTGVVVLIAHLLSKGLEEPFTKSHTARSA